MQALQRKNAPVVHGLKRLYQAGTFSLLFAVLTSGSAQSAVSYVGSTLGTFTLTGTGSNGVWSAPVLQGVDTVATMNVTISNLAGDFDPSKTLVTAANVVGIGEGAFIQIGEPNSDINVVDPSSTVDISISITGLNPLYEFQGLSLTTGTGVLAAGGLSNVSASVGSTFIETAGGADLVTSPGGTDGTPVALPGTINFNDDTANWAAVNGWTLAQHSNQWAINTPAAGEGTFISFTYTTEAVPQLFEERFMATLNFTPVPEPSVAVLSGLFGLGLIARRRR